MTDESLLRIIFAAIYSAAIIWLYSPRRRPLLRKRAKTDRETYSDGIIPPYLSMYLIVFALLAPFLGKDASRIFLSSLIVDIALCVGIYYMLLLPLLPWLRRHFSAAACAALWLIPNCLYFAVRTHTDIPRPLWVVMLPGQWGYVLLTLWLMGFLAVLGWKIVDHIRFRRYILKDANPAGAISLVYAWRRAVVEARLENTTLQLVTSPAVTAPLTIGLFRPFTRVVLPRDAQYTDEELALIFRHELIHVQRYHAWTKLLLVLCTAVCWFNPLMWIAMARSAEDLELSCDEAVLRDRDSATRRKYAHLLLNTAGSSRGFTTCLSASAEAMRYRLKNVMEPVCRRSGALLLGLLCFVMCLSGGQVALAYGETKGADAIYHGDDPSGYSMNGFSLSQDGGYIGYDVADPQPLHDYLASLPLCRLTGLYTFSQSEHIFHCTLKAADNTYWLYVRDDYVTFHRLFGGERSQYYVPGGVDWDHLYALALSCAKNK